MKWLRFGKIAVVACASFMLSLVGLNLPEKISSYMAPTLETATQAPYDLLRGLSVGLFRDDTPQEPQTRQPLPVRLKIPKIHVDARVEHVSLTRDGAMDTPKDPSDVAWLELGQRPGDEGSAVIAGHYGRQNGKGSVFDDLHKLRIGDVVTVQDDAGEDVSFVVRSMRRYDPNADASSVFGSTDGKSHLNLITCEGTWDDALGGYTKRLVVFADKE